MHVVMFSLHYNCINYTASRIISYESCTSSCSFADGTTMYPKHACSAHPAVNIHSGTKASIIIVEALTLVCTEQTDSSSSTTYGSSPFLFYVEHVRTY